MGLSGSIGRCKSNDRVTVFSITWQEFVNMICSLNEKCTQIVDSDGRWLLFAVKRNSANTVLWKATVRICALKSDGLTIAERYRVLTLAQFLSLSKSIEQLLTGPSSNCNSPNDDNDIDSHNADLRNRLIAERINSAISVTECIICMERAPDVVLPCTHMFCHECIDRWTALPQQWCPLCRQPLQMDGRDEWVLSELPQQDDLHRYLASLADPDRASPPGS